MLPKGQVNFLLLPLLVLAGVFLTAARPPTYCRNCEEEIWEEVPCRSVATPPSTTTTVRPTTTAVPPTTVAVAAAASTKLPAGSSPSTFKQCYCDCKVGCREFCRKVFVSSRLNDVKQVVHSCANANGGRYETKHSHECKFITSPKKPPHPVYTAEHKGPNPPPGNAYDLKVLTGGGPLPAKSQTGPLKNPHEDYIFEDIERLLHQNEKQTENLDFYGSAGGNELPYFGGDKEAYAKAAPAPPKGKSNYILTKSNEGVYRQAIDNYLKDYGGNEVGSNAFQAAYSVSYE